MIGMQMRDEHKVSQRGARRRDRSPNPAQMGQASRENRVQQDRRLPILPSAGAVTPPGEHDRHDPRRRRMLGSRRPPVMTRIATRWNVD
jgi:hypothetical protein